MRLVGAAEMRAIDGVAIRELGVPGPALMARAAAAVVRAARALLGPGGRALVLCGSGNNGGDGYLAARQLRAEGVEVAAIALSRELAGDALAARQEAERAGVPISDDPDAALGAGPGDVVVDALLGTGLARAPEGGYARAIARVGELRARGAKVVAVDVPSGLCADTGRPLGPCVSADVTVTFGFLKRGLVVHPGPEHAGEVQVADIGLPAAAAARVPVACELLTDEEALALVPPRPMEVHKHSVGRLLIVAGAPGTTGAAQMACSGALRGGAGGVWLATREGVLPLALAGRPEVMSVPMPGKGPPGEGDLELLLAAARGKEALLLGPGMGWGPETVGVLRTLLERARIPAVLDADAITAFAERPGAIAGLPVPAILTPHPGEMGRLAGVSTEEVQRDRIGLAVNKAREWGCVVILKGARTVVAAPDAPPAVIPTGNPGMASGGTGDVLAGLAGALLAGGLPAFDAARAAAYVHGMAGDLVARRMGQRGLLASDLADALGEVWRAWGR